MEYILLGVVCFGVGYIWAGVAFTLRFKRILEEAAHEVGVTLNKKDAAKLSVPLLITEQHGDMLYLFEKETDSFMCQGNSLQDLMEKLSEYKDIHLAFVEHNKKGFWFSNGEILDHPTMEQSIEG